MLERDATVKTAVAGINDCGKVTFVTQIYTFNGHLSPKENEILQHIVPNVDCFFGDTAKV